MKKQTQNQTGTPMLNNIMKQIKTLDFSKYAQYFSKENFDKFIGSFGSKVKFLRPLFALYFAAMDPQTPKWAKALIIGVIGYVILPIDLIPDMVPIAGLSDDLIAVTFMIGQASIDHNGRTLQKADEAILKMSKRF
ncbi:MAG: DUF1232 domain-containing protein [Ignavibacteriales bacterium]|nr:DUF1232 domain-containing protein [Ignavibacteriales bacterium]